MAGVLDRFRTWARAAKGEAVALALAMRDPRTPWYAKLLVAAVVAYALSPIDLIPDFIPVLGYLHDLLLVPLGVALALRLIPSAVVSECRQRVAAAGGTAGRRSRGGAVLVVTVWLLSAAVLASLAWRHWIR